MLPLTGVTGFCLGVWLAVGGPAMGEGCSGEGCSGEGSSGECGSWNGWGNWGLLICSRCNLLGDAGFTGLSFCELFFADLGETGGLRAGLTDSLVPG